MSRVQLSSQSVHWATPAGVFRRLNEEFHFTMDPCPLDPMADGKATLFTPWAGQRAYVNPPYGRGIRQWLNRWHEPDLAVYLLPARTDTAWFHSICLPHASEIRFLKGRLTFGDAKNPAPFPSMVVVFQNKNATRPAFE